MAMRSLSATEIACDATCLPPILEPATKHCFAAISKSCKDLYAPLLASAATAASLGQGSFEALRSSRLIPERTYLSRSSLRSWMPHHRSASSTCRPTVRSTMSGLALVISGLGCAKTQPCALATSRTDSQQAGSPWSAGPCCFVAEQHQALYTPAALPVLQSE